MLPVTFKAGIAAARHAFVDGFGDQPQPGTAGPDAFAIPLTRTTHHKGRCSSYAVDDIKVDFAVQVLC